MWLERAKCILTNLASEIDDKWDVQYNTTIWDGWVFLASKMFNSVLNSFDFSKNYKGNFRDFSFGQNTIKTF